MHILVVDDHPLFRAGIRTALGGLTEDIQVSECESCEEALEILRSGVDFSLILLDLLLSGVDGMTGMTFLRKTSPSTPIVVLSAGDESSNVKQAIERGAKGFIPKSAGSDVILSAIQLVLAGGVYLPLTVVQKPDPVHSMQCSSAEGDNLTLRQREVLFLLAQGCSNKQIASRLDLAENTVRVHVASILKLLNVKNRTEAGYQAIKLGLV